MKPNICQLFLCFLIAILASLPSRVECQVEKKMPEKQQPTATKTGGYKKLVYSPPPKAPTPPPEIKSYARLVVTTDLNVKINVNGVKTYNIHTTDELMGLPLDEGLNILKITPMDGGDDGYTQELTVNTKGNIPFVIDLGAKRKSVAEARKREEQRLATARKQEAERQEAERQREIERLAEEKRMKQEQEQQRKIREAEEKRRQELQAIELKRQEEERKKQEEKERIHKIAVLNSIDSSLVLAEGGAYTMGINDWTNVATRPERQVRLKAFKISKFEVTQEQWQAVMGTKPSYFSGCSQCPVEMVSWDDVTSFIMELNRQTGRRYRLPTEAEWEYAARGGKRSKGFNFAGGNEAGDVVWYERNSGGATKWVGKLKPNELGLFDMSGNVAEWVQDCWHANFTLAPVDGGAWLGTEQGDCNARVIKGGAWNSASPWDCFVPERRKELKTNRLRNTGFRLAEDL